MQARIIAGIIIIVGLVGYLAILGFEEGRSYYVTCDEVAASTSEFTPFPVAVLRGAQTVPSPVAI